MLLRVMTVQLVFCLMALAASVKVQAARGAVPVDGAARAAAKTPSSNNPMAIVGFQGQTTFIY